MTTRQQRPWWQTLVHVVTCLTLIVGISGVLFTPVSRGQETTDPTVEAPTETPVPEPTETPIPEPTETPTEAPADTPAPDPTDPPEDTPEPAPAEEPAERSTSTAAATDTPVAEWEPFNDDFESGNLDRWTRVDGLVVQSQDVLDGAYAARAASDGQTAAEAYAELSVPQDRVYARLRVKVVAIGADPVTLFRLRGAENEGILSLFLDSEGFLAVRNDVVDTRTVSATALDGGSWHEIILRAETGAQGRLEVWIDDVRVEDLSGPANLGNAEIGLLRLGESALDRTFDLRFDGVLIDRREIESDPRFRATPTPVPGAEQPAEVPAAPPAESETPTPQPAATEAAPPATIDIDERAYQESAGQVVIEAEAAQTNDPSTDGASWVPRDELAGFTGEAYMSAEPDNGATISEVVSGTSPHLAVQVQFESPGDYYVWVRAYASSGGSDSLHVGLDGASAERIRVRTQDAWTWTSETMRGGSARLTVTSAGQHTVDLWMREDGVRVDRIILTLDPSYVPSDEGPSASARVGEIEPQAVEEESFVAAAAGDPAFLESGGLVVMEAEHAHTITPRNGDTWSPVTAPTGFAGTGALQALPDDGSFFGSSYAARAPQLDFQITFATTGTFYVWIRAWGPNPNSDSLHAGLDGQELPSADKLQSGLAGWSWSRSTMDGVPASLDVTSNGLHTLNLWMREDGVAIDRVLLTTDPAFTPSGTGPNESPRSGTPTPTATPTATATGVAGANIAVENRDGVPFPDRLVFSRIGTLANPPTTHGVHDRAELRVRNTGAAPLTVSGLTISGPWVVDPAVTLPAVIPDGSSIDVGLRFIAEGGDLNTGTLTIASNDPDSPSTVVQLAGFWQSVPEGGQEPTLAEAVQTFGYTTNVGTAAQLNRAGRVERIGDEVLVPYWALADPSQPVAVYQLAAYHGSSINGIFAWHAKGDSATAPLLDSAETDNQTMLPRQTGSASLLASTTFTPSAPVFGFWLDGEWSDPTLNDQSLDQANGCTGACGHHVRVWPAKDRQGNVIPNAYIFGMDYRSINYDFQDTLYLITNIVPETSGGVTPTPTPPPGEATIKINFQPESASLPLGYIADTGLAFSTTSGFGWIRQDSVTTTHTPLDLSANTRDRNRPGIDQRLDTIIHMQMGTPGAWEYTVENGRYAVSVSVGDVPSNGIYNSVHRIKVEGVVAIAGFQANATHEYELATVVVDVTDGRITIDAIGGTNSKMNYVEIVLISTTVNHPSVTGTDPLQGATNVLRTAAVNVDVSLPNTGSGVEATTLTTANVVLYRTSNNTIVAGNINTTGGGDAIVYQPSATLAANTNYTFRITNGVKDDSGASFVPFSLSFTTGSEPASTFPPVSFEKSTVFSTDSAISTVMIGPDHRLYAAFLDGTLKRWEIAADGTLNTEETFMGLAGRAIIGIVFDPLNANVIWISHNAPIYPQPAPDFTGRISKLTLGGGGFSGTLQDYIVNLPRSAKDHLTNSLAFGPDGMLYVNQGSNSAMGAPDNAWDLRPERTLSGNVLRINPRWTGVLPIDVRTTDGGGSYNPFAAGAPVTIFAEGVRNAYDLVWHSNGSLYVPANGSAAGGVTPGSPAGVTPVVPALNGARTQNDFLFRISGGGGGYYGHPNPQLGHYVLNGGNPTNSVDSAEVTSQVSNGEVIYEGYPVGIQPDADYRYFVWDFGRNRSPNGVIEYKSSTFGGEIRNKLLVVEYSGGDDILILTPGPGGTIVSAEVLGVPAGLTNPLDLIEDPTNGNIYVVELVTFGFTGATGVISLLHPEE